MRVAISHHIPGRIRLEIEEMRHQPLVAYQLQMHLETVPGVQKVNCNESTGRALIYLDERTISVQQVVQTLERYLAKRTQKPDADAMVAATSEWEVQAVQATSVPNAEKGTESAASAGKSLLEAASTGAASIKQAVQNTLAPSNNPYRLPAIASGGMLGVLAVKRLLFGRSLLATAPMPFYLTAGVSIVAGYPVFRRGLEKTLDNKRFNPDLLLGLVTMGLAVMRENLVALSAITLLNIAMYHRHKVIRAEEATHLPPELERHSRQMTRAGFVLSPLTWLFTGSPLRALGVLLAANPRPATLAHKYAWAQAEEKAVQKGLPLPKCGTMEALAVSKTIVFAEGVSLNEDSQDWSIQTLQEEVEESKAIAIAASLLQKETEHPLQKPLLEALEKEHRTLRTPFHVERSEDDSVRGQVNGHDVILCTKEYAKKNELDLTNALLQERRMRRDGFKPFLLVQDGELLALFGCKQQLVSTWCERIESWQNQGYEVRYLQRDEHVPCPIDMMTVHELTATLDQNKPVLMLGGENLPTKLQDHPHLIHLQASDASRLDELFDYCSDVQARVRQDIGVVKAWNRMGTGLAIFAPLTAPLINLMSDTLGVFLLARQNWRNKRAQKLTAGASGASQSAPGLFLGQESVNQATYYAMQQSEVLTHVGSRLNGLTHAEVATRQKKYGANVLQAPEPPKPLRLFLGQFKEFSTLILIGACVLSLAIGEYFNAVCMGGILVVNAAIGTYQEIRSTSVLQALKSEENTQAKAIRDDQECLVPISQLVPGDLVLLEAGDMVPADMRIVEAWNLEVNESMLTGESLPASKSEESLALDTPLADRHNLLYMGTTVTRGRARAVVVAIGSNTQIGALQSLLTEKGEDMTPLQKRVSEFSKRMVTGALIAGGVVAVVGLMRGIPPLELLISSITLAASAIPEGLPLTITIALTAGVMRMAKKKAIVRKLGSLESLGRVTVICSDKTGTLTRNEMTVKELSTVSGRVHVKGDGYDPTGEFLPSDSREQALNKDFEPDLQQLLTIGLLCNNASVEQDGDLYKAMGDPTESALITVAMKAGLKKGNWKRHREIPFDSFTGSMSVVCEETENNNCLLLSKGSPEAILKKCTHYQSQGEIHPLTEEIREEIEAENKRMAEQALRVLGFGYRKICDDETPQDAIDEGLVYVGLMGMIDPPKEDVAKSIAEARTLGIKPVMITGDHPITARAIGQQLGIYCEGDRILTGTDLEEMSAEQLAALVPTTSIFARVSPEHKLRIVEAYQKNGEVVAMTGDGVNDAPAVRKADVGIAMGVKGTDITKDTAGIVLTEDHFHSIVDGIKEGRMIIGNIRKAIGCLLTGNLAEVLVTATAVIVGLPMPLIPLQILLMNLLTDALPAMVLATDAKRTDTEQRHKDVVDRSLYRTVLTRGSILGVGALATFAVSLATGLPLPVAQTMTFATLVAGQLIQTVSWRNHGGKRNVKLREDRPLLAAMTVSWLALASAIYIPGLQGIFFTAPLTLPHWAIVLGVSGSVTTLSGKILDRKREHQAPNLQAPMQPLLVA